MKKEVITNLIRQIHQLPTLPSIYFQLEHKIANPNTTATEVAAVIEGDPALTTTILRVVNSAFYGFSQTVATASRAVVMLGFNEIKHIALSISIMRFFKKGIVADEFNAGEFWRHSLATAVCARVIAAHAPDIIKIQEEAFTAGLIHDIGKIIEHQFLHDLFIESIRTAQQKHITISDAERITMGVTHATLGEGLLIHWKLPPVLARTVRYHNAPQTYTSGLAFPLTSVIHLADAFVRALELGNGGDPFIPPICKESCAVLKLKPSQVKSILAETEDLYYKMLPILPLP